MNSRSHITTHILDTSRGVPAAGVDVVLEINREDRFEQLTTGTTNADGRILDWLGDASIEAGRYRICFDTAGYFEGLGVAPFFPSVTIEFEIRDPFQHYHVPLLLNPYGYSTYRGS